MTTVNSIFKENGLLADLVAGYEFRPEQLAMAEFISKRLSSGGHALVEAGTGTGKTLAYLVPAILHAKKHNLRITVSTETKALQKQLMDKDLPAVRRLLAEKFDIEFSSALCMGSGNYVCRRRYELALRRGIILPEDRALLEETRTLLAQEKMFSRFDVSVPNRIWLEICREPEICGFSKCSFSQICPFMMARRKWAGADVLVTNHYMFFANLEAGKNYLPKSDVVIFDEAHSVEDIGCAQLSFDCSQPRLQEILDRFHHPRRKNTLLANVENANIRAEAVALWQKISAEGQTFFNAMAELLPYANQWTRIIRPVKAGGALQEAMSRLVDLTNSLKENLDDESASIEADIAAGRLAEFAANLNGFLSLEKPNYVYWIEASGSGVIPEIHCKGEPLRIADIMRHQVIREYDSAVFVSATLSTAGDFSYAASLLGMERWESIALPSPFAYDKQAVLFIDKSISEPNAPEFILQAAKRSADLIRAVNGNCLLLFTSYKMLEAVRAIIADLIPNRIYSQGDLPSQEAIEMYMSDENSVLMGTHSFWQGIDLPGDLLRCVIMTRLPFSVPDSPLVKSRIDSLKEQNINPFVSYQIPEAVLKFRQGFGRLIRSKKDAGIIAVLDARIVSKSYGKTFLASVPECIHVYDIPAAKEAYMQITSKK